MPVAKGAHRRGRERPLAGRRTVELRREAGLEAAPRTETGSPSGSDPKDKPGQLPALRSSVADDGEGGATVEPTYRVISVKLRRAEAEEFRRVCRELGVTPNAAFRSMARHAGGFVEIDPAARAELSDLLVQVRGIATNVNQIAKAANRKGRIELASFDEERKTLAPLLLSLQTQTRMILDTSRRKFDGRERLGRALASASDPGTSNSIVDRTNTVPAENSTS